MKVALKILLAVLLTASPSLVTIDIGSINIVPEPAARCQPAKADTLAAFHWLSPRIRPHHAGWPRNLR